MKKELLKLTKKDLLELADQSGIKVSKRMTNKELVDILMKNKDKFIADTPKEMTKDNTFTLESLKKETLIKMVKDFQNSFHSIVKDFEKVEMELLDNQEIASTYRKRNIILAESKANYKIFLMLSLLANVLLLIPFI